MPVALSLAGGFAVGFSLRAWLQRYFAVAFRTQFALGLGSLAVLAGWSFHDGVGDIAALEVPPALWVLVLGPFPMATLSFSRLYGFSAWQAASGLALSTASAVALLPLALALP